MPMPYSTVTQFHAPVHPASQALDASADLSAAFAGSSLAAVAHLLRFLYNPEHATPCALAALASRGELSGLAALAHKLDCPSLLAHIELRYLDGELWAASHKGNTNPPAVGLCHQPAVAHCPTAAAMRGSAHCPALHAARCAGGLDMRSGLPMWHVH